MNIAILVISLGAFFSWTVACVAVWLLIDGLLDRSLEVSASALRHALLAGVRAASFITTIFVWLVGTLAVAAFSLV
ncbi:hypothetical protein SAMN04489859_102150 [Paracoccus alcaliphilus]|uniref:Uncharacterized protein n=1 Tax=Paracoccus alcaliphilus TaxID=34002 RepID=A0A1H8KBA9_9RHOB|nr:hypothetical protein [Paracoccus alcaliphilus]WCR17074.1 hypothetical protein JHW40_11810 [Paracoccus alcaliphilus]SEN90263.1 hypothetical protein SAMN04489859_102150 [Paracoccus alcaliphilus]